VEALPVSGERPSHVAVPVQRAGATAARQRVLVTGSGGLLGSALRGAVTSRRSDLDVFFARRADADLSDHGAARALLARTRPDVIVHCAARVGGIKANAADQTGFLLDNLAIDTSLFRAALDAGVERLVYLGSSCTYPRNHRQPLVESDLLQAPLEPTNEGYALAKLAGTRLCQFASEQRGVTYRALVASNLYGPGDDFSSDRAHLVAAALAKVQAAHAAGAPTVTIWGDGTARREFTYAGDLAAWIVGSLGSLDSLPPVLNVGAGVDHSVTEYYEAARAVVGYRGEFVYDTSMPKGMHQKLMDSSVARGLGWSPTTSLEDGMRATLDSHLSALVTA